MNNDNELLAMHPARVLVWLQDWLNKGNVVSPDNAEIHWLGLAEISAARASDSDSKYGVLESLLWGTVAIKVYEELAKPTSNSSFRAMIVRVTLIRRFGNYPNDSLLDSKLVVNWFYQTLPMSFDEAQHNVQRWHSDPWGRTFEFKLIVEHLRMLKELVSAQRLQPDSQLQDWLGILGKLED